MPKGKRPVQKTLPGDRGRHPCEDTGCLFCQELEKWPQWMEIRFGRPQGRGPCPCPLRLESCGPCRRYGPRCQGKRL